MQALYPQLNGYFDLFATLWSEVVASWSPQTIEFVGTLAVQILSFWLPSITYLCLDWIVPSFSNRHKIQPAPKQPTRQDIVRCFVVVIQNQILSSVLHATLLFVSSRAGSSSSYRVESSFPELGEVVRDFVICLLMREAMFYYSHRLLHVPYLYRRIHKKHHRFTAPIALAAQYAHPIEHWLPRKVLGIADTL